MLKVASVERSMLFNTLLAAFITISTSFLWAVGESRADAYISLYTLEYLVLKAVLRPKKIARDYIAVALVITFSIFIAKRVLEVLGL